MHTERACMAKRYVTVYRSEYLLTKINASCDCGERLLSKSLTRFPLTPSYLVEGYPCRKRWPRVNSSWHRSDLWQFGKYPTELASADNEESKPGCIPSAKR